MIVDTVEDRYLHLPGSSRRTPRPIPRDLSIAEPRSTGRPIFVKLLPVVMGPGVRRDDSGDGGAVVTNDPAHPTRPPNPIPIPRD